MANPYAKAGTNALGSILGYSSYQNPADAAMPYLNQIQSTITPYYQPYIDAGQKALGNMQNVGQWLLPQMQSLISNPAGFMNQMGSQFQQSPGYQYNVQQSTNAANQAAAAGGMVGSPAEQQSLAQDISGMANQDYYNYLDHILKIYSGGMKGLGGMGKFAENIYGTGFNASNELAQSLANALMSQARMQMAGTMGSNESTGGLIGGLTSAVGSLF
jgi:hypothetical protein